MQTGLVLVIKGYKEAQNINSQSEADLQEQNPISHGNELPDMLLWEHGVHLSKEQVKHLTEETLRL